MTKGLHPIIYASAGVLAAGILGYAVLSPQFEEIPEPTEVVEATAEPEKDGSSVIAGSGPANSKVTLFDGSTEIGEAVSGPVGDFAFVLDKPLSPGPHELHLLAKPEDGDAIASKEAGLINIPGPDAKEEPTVLVSANGQATKILQKPEKPAEPASDVTASASESVEVAKAPTTEPAVTTTAEAEPAETTTPEPEAEVAAAPEPEVEAEAATEQESEVAAVQEPEPEAAPEPAAIKPVLIEAADIESGRIYIAGTGEPGSSVSIYLENELLGTTSVGAKGAFLFEGDRKINRGRYSIRADMIDPSKGNVIARAEVRLIHEPKILAEAPKTEPEKVEISEPQPTEPQPVEQQVTEQQSSEPQPAGQQPVETQKAEETTSKETQANEEVAAVEAPAKKEDVKAIVEPEDDSVPEIRTGSAVIIRRGDNLWQVARRNYGSGFRYTTIFEANRDQVRDPDLIYPGQVLKVPENDQDETDTSNG